MGHANLSNISKRVNRIFHQQDTVSIKQIVDHLVDHKQAVHASEGLYTDRFMLSYAVEEIMAVLEKHGYVEPVKLSKKQKLIFKQWHSDKMTEWDCGEYAILDSINWRPLKKRFPVLRNFTN